MLRAVLILALVFALGFVAYLNIPRFGGRYILHDSAHGEVMTSGQTAQTKPTINILFVGNSLTSTNDLPAMLVNLAAADEGNTTQLAVKAFTHPGASLKYMLTKTDAFGWAKSNPVDYIVLQEQSGWYGIPRWIATARENAIAWRDALAPLNVKPVLFESWADLDGSRIYTESNYFAYGKNFDQVTADSRRETGALALELGWPVIKVGRAFSYAVKAGAQDLFQRDRHHPDHNGTYLAALMFYRFFTGRSGAESTYRPWGMTASEAAVLVEAAGR